VTTSADRTPTPVFLLSLPRAGSTLVQRVLAAHEEISTAPEPWVLLPQVYATRERGIAAEYGQVPASRAIREFAENLPGGGTAYDQELRGFSERLYARASSERTRFFLDKTPRYHLIAEDLFRIFPDARFVFLWRNPLAVAASIVETWGRGRWIVDRYRIDLFDGVGNLVRAFDAHRDRALAVRFEDLVGAPDTSWPTVLDHLGLRFDPALLTSFRDVRLDARMGDPTGATRYDELSTEPLDKWRSTLGGAVRARWARNYLRWIGGERLSVMGYDLGELLREIDGLPSSASGIGSDLARTAYGRISAARKRRGRELAERRRGPGAHSAAPEHRA
jgi:hypothetical protein